MEFTLFYVGFANVINFNFIRVQIVVSLVKDK